MRNLLTCRVVGVEWLRFMNLCKYNHYTIENIRLEEAGFVMSISLRDYNKIEKLLEKTGVQLQVLNRQGPAFWFRGRWQRISFLIGLFGLCFVIWHISQYIWYIDITGNKLYTDELLLQSLNEMHIECGIRKSSIDLPNIEEELRLMHRQITWVSASIIGTKLHIEIKEGDLKQYEEIREDNPSNIVSATDAVITSVVTRSGTPLVDTGTEVKKGQLLIEGKLYIYNDDETLIKIDYVQADADINGNYVIAYDQSYQRKHLVKKYIGDNTHSWQIFYGRWSLNFPFGKKTDQCEIWSEKQYLRLTPTFYLPFAIERTTYKSYEWAESYYTDEALKKLAQEKLDEYLDNLMKKGVQIIANSVKIVLDAKGCHVSGNIKVNGSITKQQPVLSQNMAGIIN